MPIFSARQVSHFITITMPSKWSLQYYDNGGTKITPSYERGAWTAVNTLRDERKIFWSYMWSAQVEGNPDMLQRCETALLPVIGYEIKAANTSRSDKWQKVATDLSLYALRDARHRHPPDGPQDPREKYDHVFLCNQAGFAKGNYPRDCEEQWEALRTLMDRWVVQSLAPLAKWIESKKEAA